jgi:uncharacterized protein (DUF885 family)
MMGRWWLVLIGGFLVMTPERAEGGQASAKFQELLREAWEFRLRENPLLATDVGDHRFDDRLPSVGLADEERRRTAHETFLRRWREIPRSELEPEERIDYDIFGLLEKNRLEEFRFHTYLMPITNRSGFHVSFPQLHERVPLRTVRDYENYISRLRGFLTYARQHIEKMREGIRLGYVLPRVVLQGIDEAVAPHIVEEARQSRLYAPFEDFPETIPEGERQRLAREGAQAIMESVVPGYREFLEFLRNEYIPAAREEISASALPDGRAFYAYRVRRFTTLDLTPEEVHEMGLAEVRRIRQEMEAIIREVGFQGSFREFLEFLRTDDRFYVDTPDQLLKEVAYVLKRMDGELPRLFGRLPRIPYGIKAVPDYIAPRTTTAYYEGPPGDGSRAGFYYVNTYDLKSRPLYEIEALSLHEAVPGHHLQIALQQELEHLPMFRRFSGFTAFSEGWALYAERLGLEVGFYEDPYSNFGRLTYEMWRACRLVVDTGIHAMGWSRQQAIDFMAENTALTLHNIETEVDRYISWPGQALAYKIGEMKIRELRRRAQEALGERFDVRAFHDVVLGSGAVPLSVLEENVTRWIAQVSRDQ